MSEFAVNPSRLPHRTVADRRRTAQRVQERFQTVHRGAQERPLSAAIIGSDHVNFGHGEYTVSGCDSLLFNYLVDGPCLHYVPKFFFLRAVCNGVFTTAAHGFPCLFSTFSVVILQGPTVFRGPHWHLSLSPRRPRNQLSTYKPYPCGPQTPAIGPLCLIRLFLRCHDRSNNLLRSFCTNFHLFLLFPTITPL